MLSTAAQTPTARPTAAGRRFWPTLGWGALISVVGVLLAALFLVTIVGIPFGLGMLSALNVLAPLGYVASSLILGRLMVKSPTAGGRIGAFFAGFAILRVAALIPGLGFLVSFLACIFGVGALWRAAWAAGHRGPETVAVAPGEAPPTSIEERDQTVTTGTPRYDAPGEPAPE